ncbi:MAG: DUF937 domain-containing protein [Cardiobacteriaceae bacterium]|nr:DUF937 domain-containing protein [Cardiobacteriaceae bacterium]
MGMLDSVLGQVAGQLLGGKNNALTMKLLQSLIKQLGGMAGLFQKLQAGGLAAALASWIGNGNNQSVSAEAMANALGADLLSQAANHAGIDDNQASALLAQHLPNIINSLTPNGIANEADGFDLSDGLDMKDLAALASKFMK